VFTRCHRGGSGPPLVCLHGFIDTWRVWELVLPALERRHDVLAPTLPGHAGGPPGDRVHRHPPRAHPAGRYRRDWLPQADWVELDGIGHCPQLDVPLETAQLILGFTGT
jgi:pimeloyl-ACP methyl ester carboxylesterase